MPHQSWNDRYASEEPLPWDTGTPDPMLVEFVESHAIVPGRALEVGCGTGTNAIYLAQHAFEVVGVDISPLAVDKARDKARGRCRFETVDFLSEAAPGGPFQFVRPRLLSHVRRRSRARAVRTERSCGARRWRYMAEPDRQH
jgi:SAM-dependent methyltransferase